MARILVEGSSTAYGLWSNGEGGWVDKLKATLINASDRRKFAAVVNLSAPSKTIADSISTLEVAAEVQSKFGPTRLSLIQPGMIESRKIDGEHHMQPHDFDATLRKLGAISMRYGFTPIFIGMTPIDEERTASIEINNQIFSYTTHERIRYDNITRTYADEQGFQYLDIGASLAEKYPDPTPILDNDGLHMNSIGHTAMYELILPTVLEEMERQRELKTYRTKEAM